MKNCRLLVVDTTWLLLLMMLWSPTTTSAFVSIGSPLHRRPPTATAALSPASLIPRGGAGASTIANTLQSWTDTPLTLFNGTFVGLALLTILTKLFGSRRSDNAAADDRPKKPQHVAVLQRKFLAVFWLLRCADWLQGPYFYEVYASKIFNGAAASLGLVSQLFLTGFASTALFGPLVGRAADQYGRKKATLAYTVLYALGALSTQSNLLRILFLGRLCSGIGTSLLFSAPESWVVSEFQDHPEFLGETFGWAYAGDSIVAILAGQLAAFAAHQRGPTGPFEWSTGCLVLAGLLCSVLWKENTAQQSSSSERTTIRDAISVIQKDRKILWVGAVQSLFEAAMYIFVLQWPPAIQTAIEGVFGGKVGAPFGTIFSCFMACCLLGSTMFGNLAPKLNTETSTMLMLGLAAISMGIASTLPGLAILTTSLFLFESCVGFYFPSIGTLRSTYVPDSHRSVIMNLFGIPLNIFVVSVFLSIQKLGIKGALTISSGLLGLATFSMWRLRQIVNQDAVPNYQILKG